MRKTRAATEDELLRHAQKHAHWFLQCGTTTVEAKSGYGLSVEDELKLLRVIRRLERGKPDRIRSDISRRACGAGRISQCARSNMSRWSFMKCCRAWPKDSSRNTAIFFASAVTSTSRDRGKNSRRGARTWLALADACRSTDEFRRSISRGALRAATADHLEQDKAAGDRSAGGGEVQPVLAAGLGLLVRQRRVIRARAR